jgi:glycerol kinase
MNAILALDQGTTSSRALLFGERGEVLALAQREFRQIYPQPGWVEHDADEIWRTQREVMDECLARVPGARVGAIGITNQRETTVVWNRRTGRPIANAIVWQDRRTAADCARMKAHEPTFHRKTGLLLDPYFSGTKLAWLLQRAQTRDDLAFGTIDSWLIWNLTGGAAHVTDVTNASRTLLFNIHERRWDDELLQLLEIPRDILPEVRHSGGVIARTNAGIPICGVAGDQQAALFGQRCTRAGMAKNTYGTGSFIVMHTGGTAVESSRGLLTTIACGANDYALEGSIFVTGAAVQWLRDGLGIIKTAADIEPLAASVPDANGVVFVPAFTGLGTPHWNPHVRGTITGLTRGATAAHLARATLDAIALQTVDVLEAMREASGIALTELRVDGGGSTNDLLMQLQADLTGIPVIRTRNAETTALGAAQLAGLASGFWTESDLDAQWQKDRTFEPRLGADERAARMTDWRKAIRMAES